MGLATETPSEAPSNDEETNRMLGGYKATLTNEATSAKAKAHAREVLDAAGIDIEGYSGSSKSELDEHAMRVFAGYKAALHNPKVSDEAKAHAREYLREHGQSA